MEHLTIDEVARFLEKALLPDEHARVVAHMDECSRCRDEVVAAGGVVRGRRRRHRWLLAVPALAAAALLLFFVSPDLGPLPDPTELRGADERIPPISVIAPLNDTAISADSVTFVWGSTGPRSQYVFTVTSSVGQAVIEASTTDTTMTVSVVPSLVRGEAYFWYVDGVLMSGESTSSGVHRFSIR